MTVSWDHGVSRLPLFAGGTPAVRQNRFRSGGITAISWPAIASDQGRPAMPRPLASSQGEGEGFEMAPPVCGSAPGHRNRVRNAPGVNKAWNEGKHHENAAVHIAPGICGLIHSLVRMSRQQGPPYHGRKQ